MKKIVCLLLMFVLLAGCTPQSGETENDNLKVVASFAPVHAITLAVTKGVEGLDVSCMASSSAGCLHDYQLTTEDMAALENADLFIIGGAGMEGNFLDKIKENYPNLEILDASEHTVALEDEHGHTNPHIWLSVENSTVMSTNIASRLSKTSNENAQVVSKNLKFFHRELTQIKEKYLNEFTALANNKIITFHEAFQYLGDEFGVDVVGVIETEPGVAPDPRTLSKLVDMIKTDNVAAVFTEPQYPSDTAQVLHTETGVKVSELDPIVTGEMNAESFVTRFENNLKILSETLT